MSIVIKSGASADLLTVDANGNTYATTPTLLSNLDAGFGTLVAESDAGSVTATRTTRALEIQEDFATRFGTDFMLFHASFNGTTLDPNKWYTSLSTMTQGPSGGFETLNAASDLTSGTYALLFSRQCFQYFGTQTMYVEFRAKITGPRALNASAEIGIGIAATTAIPTDGIFFRWGLGGTLNGVVNIAGVEYVGRPIIPPTDGETHSFYIAVTWTEVEFWIDDVLQDRISVPGGEPQATRTMALPFYARVYNNGVPSEVMKVNLASVAISIGGAIRGRTLDDASSSYGKMAQQGDATWTTPNLQSNWTNSGSAAVATMSNNATPSGGYTGTTLGALWAFNSLASAVTDLIVFNYLNPAGTAAVEGQTLYISDVNITTSTEGAAFSASTPTVINWFLGFGSTATDLGTADAATTRAPRRIPLGTQSWIISAARGTPGQPITVSFGTPIKVDPGTYLHIGCREILGVAFATTAVYFRGAISLNGYRE